MARFFDRVMVAATTFIVVLSYAGGTRAEDTEATTLDRVAVRYVTPETGAAAHPRFLTERELAFFTRIEALFEQVRLEENEYPERYVRTAVERLVARSMLASLTIQRGLDPADLPRLAIEARSELEARLGGPHVLTDTLKKEGLAEEELLSFLRDQVRAMHYLDRAVTPILAVTEDALREAYRGALQPFRGSKFDEVRQPLRRWLVTERLRAAELEYFQGARSRIKVTTVHELEPARVTSSAQGIDR